MSTDLRQAFKTACDLFNGAKYNDLGPLVDIDIVMKKVDDPGSIVGIGNVITYLNLQQAQQKPQFEVDKIETVRGADGTMGQISGTAHYQDKKRVNVKILVRFTFTFTRDDLGDDWMLINAFAAPME
jgi:hypothetical protein